ncbi:MAG: sigma-70 family RNA polymerase sigma factor [Phycisphaeraceae bacterium]|nr:sigma-70 family RNA polymerase sigma factor [Phycisphaeraceae bacterium]
MTDDARDLALVRAGRTSAGASPGAHEGFARIYDRHGPVVRALCRQNSPCDADADDALQETFLRAYRMLDRLTDPDGLRSWLYAIARLVCSERRRAARRRTAHEHGAAGENGLMPAHAHTSTGRPRPEGGASPRDAADRAEQLDRLSRAMEQLPDNERLAVHLYYLETDPVAAASVALGVSRSGFYKLLSRARERLSALLSEAHA